MNCTQPIDILIKYLSCDHYLDAIEESIVALDETHGVLTRLARYCKDEDLKSTCKKYYASRIALQKVLLDKHERMTFLLVQLTDFSSTEEEG